MAAWKKAVLVALAALVGILSAVAQTEHRPGSRPVSLELWGSSITVQGFLSLANPATLHRIPRDAWQTKVTWGADTLVFRWVGGTPPPTGPRDTGEGHEDVRPAAPFLYVHCTNSISHMGQRDVYFGASSTVMFPPFFLMPYMDVTARLWWLVGGWPYLPVGITYSNGWNVWRVTTNDIQRVSSGGEYQVESWHFAEAPWGYEPRYQFAVRWSSVVRVP